MKRLALMSSVVAVLIATQLCQVVRAEEDHLLGYLAKDLDNIQPGGTYTFDNGYGTTTCELKKAKYLVMGAEKNGGDDPRGTAKGTYVCYKAKCDGALPGAAATNDQFASHTLDTKKVKIICAPAL